MATLLYEELDIEKTATTEQIRKAYKKKALQTHPDRLPPTATKEQKRDADERFRKVNHAYEILSDPEKRKEYDIHGVWPPPEQDIPRTSTNEPEFFQTGFDDPFFSFHNRHQHHHKPFQGFVFSDPFSLFDSIFGDMLSERSGGFGFYQDPFERFERLERELDREFFGGGPSSSIFGSPFGSPFSLMTGPRTMGMLPIGGAFSMFPAIEGPTRTTRTSSYGGGGGQWVSESYMTQTINGVTETVHQRIDAQGNEHITRTLPGGQKVTTINGVEQRPPTNRLSNSQPQQILPAPSDSYSQPLPALQHQRTVPTTSYIQPQPQQEYRQRKCNNRQSSGSTSAAPPPYTPNTFPQNEHLPQGGYPEPSMSKRADPMVNGTPAFAYDRAYSAEAPPSSGRPSMNDSHHHREHHQNHLQSTHHKSHNPFHPNPSPYYIDERDRQKKKHKHHHWWSRN